MTEYQTIAGTPAQPEVQHEARTIERIEPSESYMMTEIGDGVFVQWSQCARCMKRLGVCKCLEGPQEPEYMTRWRTARFAKSFSDRGVQPLATPYAVRELLKEAQEAADMAYGDSNDEEIDALRGVAESALGLLGLNFPAGRDPDDEDEDDEEPSALEQTLGIKPEPLECERHGGPWGEDLTCARCTYENGTARPRADAGPMGPGLVDDGLDAALASVKEGKPDVGF